MSCHFQRTCSNFSLLNPFSLRRQRQDSPPPPIVEDLNRVLDASGVKLIEGSRWMVQRSAGFGSSVSTRLADPYLLTRIIGGIFLLMLIGGAAASMHNATHQTSGPGNDVLPPSDAPPASNGLEPGVMAEGVIRELRCRDGVCEGESPAQPKSRPLKIPDLGPMEDPEDIKYVQENIIDCSPKVVQENAKQLFLNQNTRGDASVMPLLFKMNSNKLAEAIPAMEGLYAKTCTRFEKMKMSRADEEAGARILRCLKLALTEKRIADTLGTPYNPNSPRDNLILKIFYNLYVGNPQISIDAFKQVATFKEVDLRLVNRPLLAKIADQAHEIAEKRHMREEPIYADGVKKDTPYVSQESEKLDYSGALKFFRRAARENRKETA